MLKARWSLKRYGEVEDLYKNGSDFYNSYSDDTGFCNDQTMRAFFDEHFLKPHHLDDLLGALINKKGIEAATVKFDETIKKTIADDKKPMMYSISIDQLMNDFEEILKYANNESVFIIDDIHWSTGMESAWEHIKSHKRVTLTIDLFFMGIVFVKSELSKENFIIRF